MEIKMFCKFNNKFLIIVLALLVISFSLDVVTTYIALNKIGAYEINPLLIGDGILEISAFNLIVIFLIVMYVLSLLHKNICLSFVYENYKLGGFIRKLFSSKQDKFFINYVKFLFIFELIIIKFFVSISNIFVIYGFSGFFIIGANWVGRSTFGDIFVLFINITFYSTFLLPLANYLFQKVCRFYVFNHNNYKSQNCPTHSAISSKERFDGPLLLKIKTALKIMGGSLLFFFFGS